MGGGGGIASFRARWRFDRGRLSLKENKTPDATLLRRTAESPLSRGERGVQGPARSESRSSITRLRVEPTTTVRPSFPGPGHRQPGPDALSLRGLKVRTMAKLKPGAIGDLKPVRLKIELFIARPRPAYAEVRRAKQCKGRLSPPN
jgi:hypothetical protein